MEGHNPSATGGESDKRAEELRKFKMTPEKDQASKVIREMLQLYSVLDQLNQAIEALDPLGEIVRQQRDELEGRRDHVIARLQELEEANRKEVERTFRLGGFALLGHTTGARECAAPLIVSEMFTKSGRDESTGYIGAIKRDFGSQLSLGDEESSE